MLICVVTGFTSGLPLFLIFNLLPAWLKTEGIDLRIIGAFALIQFPYTWKFLWAPFLDRYRLPLLGRRRGWMLLAGLGVFVAIGMLGERSPRDHLATVVWLSVTLAFMSATLDIVLDAYRRELLPDVELGLGNAVHVNAYKVAGLVPGSLSLILAETLPWDQVFWITAAFMAPGLLLALLVTEPAADGRTPRSLRDAVVEPFREFIGRQGWGPALGILAFIFLYKLGDSLCTSLATPFYLDMGYSKLDIGLVAKHAGLWPSVFGGLLGGLWMLRLGINRALWVFGFVQWAAILGFAALAWMGPRTVVEAGDRMLLALVIGAEALGVGLGTAAFVAFIARATHPAYTATQFALFTSLAAVPRTFINSAAGWMVEQMGWPAFFVLCTILAAPGMVLLVRVAPWRESNSDVK
ncbi:MAG: AmpG family muropeptide MFS transporter [Rhodocyclaceae bacterium]|nr:AmpG family muropeptide MFS transporter [Rhodocyclaceae bacterium]